MGAAYLKAPPVLGPGYVSGCTGKRGFANQGDARSAAHKVSKNHRQYRCDHCGWWHNTSWRTRNKRDARTG